MQDHIIADLPRLAYLMAYASRFLEHSIGKAALCFEQSSASPSLPQVSGNPVVLHVSADIRKADDVAILPSRLTSVPLTAWDLLLALLSYERLNRPPKSGLQDERALPLSSTLLQSSYKRSIPCIRSTIMLRQVQVCVTLTLGRATVSHVG